MTDQDERNLYQPEFLIEIGDIDCRCKITHRVRGFAVALPALWSVPVIVRWNNEEENWEYIEPIDLIEELADLQDLRWEMDKR